MIGAKLFINDIEVAASNMQFEWPREPLGDDEQIYVVRPVISFTPLEHFGYSPEMVKSIERSVAAEHSSITISEKVQKWVAPPERFIAYDKSDEWYLRWAGIGREETVSESCTVPHCFVARADANGIEIRGVPQIKAG